MKKVKERVKELLQKYPDLRNDDQELVRYYWLIYDNYIVPKAIDPKTGAPSIIRARQKIQQKGDFLPTDPKVIEQRRKQKSVMFRFALRG